MQAVDHAGVHVTHCCLDHGCKYGDDASCPVANGTMVQRYPCEECNYGIPVKESIDQFAIEMRRQLDAFVAHNKQNYPNELNTRTAWRNMFDSPTDE